MYSQTRVRPVRSYSSVESPERVTDAKTSLSARSDKMAATSSPQIATKTAITGNTGRLRHRQMPAATAAAIIAVRLSV